MTQQMTPHVAALIADLFETSAVSLRAAGEDAWANLTDPDGSDPLASLEVGRSGGDWQRNLSVSFEVAGEATSVEVRIADEERATVSRIGSATVGSEEIGTVALALARAGITRLMAELALTPAAA